MCPAPSRSINSIIWGLLLVAIIGPGQVAGIFAITEGVSLLALEAGIVGGSTWEKIERLQEQRVLPAGDLEIIDESFTYLVNLRLQRQLRALAEGKKAANTVDPLVMTIVPPPTKAITGSKQADSHELPEFWHQRWSIEWTQRNV